MCTSKMMDTVLGVCLLRACFGEMPRVCLYWNVPSVRNMCVLNIRTQF